VLRKGAGLRFEVVDDRRLMRCRTEIEAVLAHQAVGKVTYAQTVIAMACVLRHLILLLRDRIEVGKVGNLVQQRTLLAEAEQECQCECEQEFLQHDCILADPGQTAKM
jgi:hypothetical protein